MVPMAIGQYRVVRQIGKGGMGVVYLAEHSLLGRPAAIKVLLKEYSENEAIVKRFFTEAKVVTAIADPGIVQVFDFGHDVDGSAFIVMELLEGESLQTRLKRSGRLEVYEAIRLMAQIASSLGAAHAKGVIHRDLKPDNIFIVGDPAVSGGERTKILDFGIAKLADPEQGTMKTSTGVVMGTPVYMSPEQCRGASTLDHRSDIYALGCVLFTLVCGRPPFHAAGSGDLIVAHIRDLPPRPSSLIPGLIPELEAVILRCLQKHPDARFQTTSELARALRQIEAHLLGATPEQLRLSGLLDLLPRGSTNSLPAVSGGGHGSGVDAAGANGTLPEIQVLTGDRDLTYELSQPATAGLSATRDDARSASGARAASGHVASDGASHGEVAASSGTTLGLATGAAQVTPVRARRGRAVAAVAALALTAGMIALVLGGGATHDPAVTPPAPTATRMVDPDSDRSPDPRPPLAPSPAAAATAPVDGGTADAGAATDALAPAAAPPADAPAVAVPSPTHRPGPVHRPVTGKPPGRTPASGGTPGGTSNDRSPGSSTVDRGD